MICYALKCSNQHQFESWFQSSDAFEKLKSANLLACPDCADSSVEKALMAPRLSTVKSKKSLRSATRKKEVLQALMRYARDNSEDVGKKFATEARAIYVGDAPARSIHGEANLREAQELLADGVPIMLLPSIASHKKN